MSFGTVGGTMKTKEQTFPSPKEATEAVESLLAEKLDDDFVEVDPATHKPLKAQAPVVETAPPVATPAQASSTKSGGAEGLRHFEFVEGTSSKFWEVWVKGAQMMTKYGRIGSQGQGTTIKDFPDEGAARKAADKKIAEKLREGYIEK
jgi:predicted DNA-binding WGR domain protein